MENQKENVTEQETPKPGISLGDISFAIQVLKIAARRGAFELNEMKNVGELGERFQGFLNAHAPPKPEEEPVQEEPEEEPVQEEPEEEPVRISELKEGAD